VGRRLEPGREGVAPLLRPRPERLVRALGRHLVVMARGLRPLLLLLQREPAAGERAKAEPGLEFVVREGGLKGRERRRVVLEPDLALAEQEVALRAHRRILALDRGLRPRG